MTEKYLPLFRKYRPQSFKDVVGQESLVKALSNAIELNRIANAYLFAGPRGTGKTSCARIFAKSLNCINGPTLEPCQKCPSCLDITNASGLDVIEIDAATNRGIDDAKELIAQTQYAPMNGKYKIFIIDEVHMLSNEAFNALLKTFEEPPANVIFILATTEPHKVIETIVSRCQRFDLRRITTDDIVKRLREISDIEKIKITDDALHTIAKNVSGGLRDSLALLDQVSILGAREEITKEDIESLLGKVTFDVAFDFLNKILSKNIENALSSLDKIYNKGLEPKNFCENFIEFLRNLIFTLKSSATDSILRFTNFNQGDIDKIKSANFNTAQIFRILEKVIEYYKEIRFTTNPYLWAELMVINLCKDEVFVAQNAEIAAAPAISAASFAINRTELSKQAETLKEQENNFNTGTSAQKPAITAESKPAFNTEPQNAGGSIVKETLKEVDIPENIPVKESADDEVQNLSEYKETLYQNKPKEPENSFSVEVLDASLAAEENKTAKEPAYAAEPIKMPEEEPVMPEVPTSIMPQTGDIDPIAAWANVLNVIESIPAKFFYSGVGKLVGIENKKITLGFVNENAINQAKSESKFKHLSKAVQNTLGEDYSTDFILITKDTKIIDVKLTAKIQDKPKPSYAREQQNSSPDSFNGYQKSQNAASAQNEGSKNSLEDANTEFSTGVTPEIASFTVIEDSASGEAPLMPEVPTEEKKDGLAKKNILANYGQKTKEMLEAFNGEVID